MAQGYLKHAIVEAELPGKFEIKTAGVMTVPGLIPSPEAIQVMEAAEIDISGHRSAEMTPELLRKSDLILGMTPFHIQSAIRALDDVKERTFLLKEYAQSDNKVFQVNDPMGATLEVYKRVFREIRLACDKLLEKEFFTGVPDDEFKKNQRKAKKVEREKKKKDTPKPARGKKKSSSCACSVEELSA